MAKAKVPAGYGYGAAPAYAKVTKKIRRKKAAKKIRTTEKIKGYGV
jgi:hypothetical protein